MIQEKEFPIYLLKIAKKIDTVVPNLYIQVCICMHIIEYC